MGKEPLRDIAHKSQCSEQVDASPPVAPLPDDDAVAEWLDELSMGAYLQNFRAHQITNIELAATLTSSDLDKMGISIIGHQKRIKQSASEKAEAITSREHINANFAYKRQSLLSGGLSGLFTGSYLHLKDPVREEIIDCNNNVGIISALIYGGVLAFYQGVYDIFPPSVVDARTASEGEQADRHPFVPGTKVSEWNMRLCHVGFQVCLAASYFAMFMGVSNNLLLYEVRKQDFMAYMSGQGDLLQRMMVLLMYTSLWTLGITGLFMWLTVHPYPWNIAALSFALPLMLVWMYRTARATQLVFALAAQAKKPAPVGGRQVAAESIEMRQRKC
jgi:hypothetical protein